jgi:hypothetical protein
MGAINPVLICRFFLGGELWCFQGILRKRGVFEVVFGGENVVVCMVNVVVWRSLFRGRKMRQVFEIYFGTSRFGNEWGQGDGCSEMRRDESSHVGEGGRFALSHECPHLRIEIWGTQFCGEC